MPPKLPNARCTTPLACIGILATVLSCGPQARAALILDQSNVPTTSLLGTFDGAIVSGNDLAQSFTAGLAGLLAQVDVLIAQNPDTPAGDVTLTIRSVVGGVPAAALFTGTIPLASIPVQDSFTIANAPLTSIDVSSAGILLNPGDVLAITLSRTGPGIMPWVTWRSRGDTYAVGNAFFGNASAGSWTSLAADDFGFQTFVAAAAVPEPSSLAMAGLGTLGFLAYGWRRQTAGRRLVPA